MSFYNLADNVDLVIDVVGYYEPSSSGPAGPVGLTGPAGTNGAAGTNGTNGAKGDTGDPGPRPAQVVWVAQSGGDYTTVTAALASIGDNGALKPYVIKVAPGTYIEPAGILMKDYVDLEGSGQSVTTISATSSATNNTTVRVAGATHAEIRDLTIVNTGGGAAAAVALRVTNLTPAGALRVSDVTASSSGSTNDNYGAYVQSSAPIISRLTAIATGGQNTFPYTNNAASPTMTDVTATATGASGTNIAILNQTGSAPAMNDITATANGGVVNQAVKNASSSPSMNNVTATANGPSSAGNAGVANYGSSAPTMTNVIAVAGGSSVTNNGVYNVETASPTMTNVTATGTGTTGTGVSSFNLSTVRISHSTLSGSFASVYSDTAASTTRVVQSILLVTEATGLGLTCAGVIRPALALASSTCS